MDKKLINKGIRSDGRKLDEIRPMIIKAGVIDRADGSAYVEFGTTKVIVGVYGPKKVHPRHMENSQKAILKFRYNMIPFSVYDRKRPGYDKRSVEIAKVVADAFENAIFLEEFPKSAIEVDMEIIQADAGTRVAAITAASVALADAGIPMKGLVSSVAAGRVEGNIALDLTKDEEDVSDAIDLPVAMIPRTGEITLLQMDGDATVEEIEQIVKMAEKGCKDIEKVQIAALLEKYTTKGTN
ncbi:exosome complex exonuclease Rrp41 [archaeon]|nr:exosome complex exonuclease Rrp41 [archaeon]